MSKTQLRRDMLLKQQAELEGDLATARGKGSTAAMASLHRHLMRTREALLELEDDDPVSGMSAAEIIERCRNVADNLPEAVLVVFADAWAAKHRVKWRPMTKAEITAARS